MSKLNLAIVLAVLFLFPLKSHACGNRCELSDEGLALIQAFEGYSPFTYLDAANKPTIGYGHLIRPGEKFEEPLLGDAALDLLRKDIAEHELLVRKNFIPLRQCQHDALTSIVFNVGGGRKGANGRDGIIVLRSGKPSTLRRKTNERDFPGAADAFHSWNKAGGIVLRGLKARRALESILFLRCLPEAS